jgi:hypothetical protein
LPSVRGSHADLFGKHFRWIVISHSVRLFYAEGWF